MRRVFEAKKGDLAYKITRFWLIPFILRHPLSFSVRRNGSGLLVPRGGRPADDRHGSRFPRGPRSAVRVLAGLSSAFNRPSVGRSAGRLNALSVLPAGCRRHPAFVASGWFPEGLLPAGKGGNQSSGLSSL